MVHASSASLVSAQNQPLAFEVASVKPAKEYIPAVVDPQRFWIVDTLAGAILWANDLVDRGYKLSGGPPWIHRNYYQFEGRTKSPVTTKEMRTMLQTLLADRFKLKLHRESKEMSVYALIIGTSGLKLQISQDQCGRSICGMGVGPGEMIARYATMADVAATLGNMVDRPVLDETGLDAHYDIHMKFDPTSVKLYDGQPIGGPSIDAPSIFVAIQDQLGLKLEPRRAAVEILVVDSAAEPLPD
jgi:bla regulator protein blaR1